MTLVDQMQSLIENLDVEELEVYYENSKNILDEEEEEASRVHILYYPESEDMIKVANLVQNELCCGNYKRSAINIDFVNNSGRIKAIPSIRKEIITFEKEKRMFNNDDFKIVFKNALLKVAQDKTIFTCKFKLGGADEDTSNWDESDAEYFEMDLRYFDAFIEQLNGKYSDLLDHIDDYRYTISNLKQEDLSETERLFDEIDSEMDYCHIDYEFIEVDEV